MSKLTEHASYLRGLAEGMNLDTGRSENKLLLGMLEALEEMAQQTSELNDQLSDISDYVEDIENNLTEVEEMIYGDGCCDEACCDEGDFSPKYGEDGLVHFECPNCGKPVSMESDAIENEQSPVCEFCGEPFFQEVVDDENLELINGRGYKDGPVDRSCHVAPLSEISAKVPMEEKCCDEENSETH